LGSIPPLKEWFCSVNTIQLVELSSWTAFCKELESFVYSLSYYRRDGLWKHFQYKKSSFRLY